MDIIWPLILMLIFYLVPELIKKKRNPQNYKYPEVPPPTLPKQQDIIVEPSFTIPRADGVIEEQVPKTVLITTVKQEKQKGPWEEKLEPNLIVNGFIFSQILEKPRAHRLAWRKRY